MDFQNVGLDKFKGIEDVVIIQYWLTSIENTFEYLATLEGDKVTATRLMLTRQVSMWWIDYCRTHIDDSKITSLEDFKDFFLEKYIPNSVRREMRL